MSDKSHRILIVDDDEDILMNLSDILTEVGYETETASDGKIALEKVDGQSRSGNRRFDVCLLDYKMPGMDGVEFLGKIQSRIPELPAILITAYSGDDGVRQVLAAGSWKVLHKPVDIKKLLVMIDEAIAG